MRERLFNAISSSRKTEKEEPEEVRESQGFPNFFIFIIFTAGGVTWCRSDLWSQQKSFSYEPGSGKSKTKVRNSCMISLLELFPNIDCPFFCSQYIQQKTFFSKTVSYIKWKHYVITTYFLPAGGVVNNLDCRCISYEVTPGEKG